MPTEKFSKLNWLKRTNGHKFKPAEFRVLIAIFNHTNERGERAFPGLKLLAEETGHSKSTVSEAVTALRQAGWITEVSKGSGVSGNSSVFALVPDAPNPPSSSSGEEQPTKGGSSRLQELPEGVVPVQRTSSSPFQEQVVPGPRNPSDHLSDDPTDHLLSDQSEVRLTPNHLEGRDEDRSEGGPLSVEGSEATEETEGYRPEGLVGTQPSTAEGPQWSGPKEKPAPPAEPEPTARQQSCRRQSAATQVASATAADITSRAFIEAEDPWASVPANQKESA